jgi:hypothetical protein
LQHKNDYYVLTAAPYKRDKKYERGEQCHFNLARSLLSFYAFARNRRLKLLIVPPGMFEELLVMLLTENVQQKDPFATNRIQNER